MPQLPLTVSPPVPPSNEAMLLALNMEEDAHELRPPEARKSKEMHFPWSLHKEPTLMAFWL